jgi:hypothetical protein
MNTTTKHTPGPFEVNPDGPTGEGTFLIIAADDTIVAESTVVDNRANADLIAAAPDLLEACRNMLANPGTRESRRAAIAAIAKAEGGAR